MIPQAAVEGQPPVMTALKVMTPEIRLCGVAQGERTASRFYEMHRRHPKTQVWESLDVEAGKLAGAGVEAYLADRGIHIHSIKDARRWFRETADYQETVRGTMTAYENYGWKDEFEAFVYGEKIFKNGRWDRAMLSDKLKARAKFLQPKRGASLEGWSEAARSLVLRPGFEPVAFATLASLAAPLMKIMHPHEGGTIVSLVSIKSASGKSTSLAGASSVWAHDPRGNNKKVNDTKVSSGVILGQLGNLPIIHDELWSDDPRELHAEVQLFQAGEDRNRGTVDGGLKAQENTWQTVMVSASNQSLVGAVEARQGSDAMAFRVVEFQVKGHKTVLSDATVERLVKQLFDNGAVAGTCLLTYLSRPEVIHWARNEGQIEAIRARWTAMGFDQRHRYWTRLLTCMAMTVQMMKVGKILPRLDFEHALLWGIDQMKQNLEIGLEVKSEEITARELLVSFIMFHQGFQTYEAQKAWTVGQSGVVPRDPVRDPVIRRNLDTGEIFIHRSRLRQWLQIKHNTQMGPVLRSLQAEGIVLHPDSDRNLMAGTDQSTGQVACVIVNGTHPAMGGARPKPKLELVHSKEPTNGKRHSPGTPTEERDRGT